VHDSLKNSGAAKSRDRHAGQIRNAKGRTLLSVPSQTRKEVARGGIFRVLVDKVALLSHNLGHLIASAIRAAIRKI